ncbi:MAG: hypothetical protein LH614_03605 [Pyrinomonadaceae bacterium]|nr:hypothetical protein [Pyrinomonadaceae bacterium]
MKTSAARFGAEPAGVSCFVCETASRLVSLNKETPGLKNLDLYPFTEDAAGGVCFVLPSVLQDKRTKIGLFKDERLTIFDASEALTMHTALINRENNFWYV